MTSRMPLHEWTEAETSSPASACELPGQDIITRWCYDKSSRHVQVMALERILKCPQHQNIAGLHQYIKRCGLGPPTCLEYTMVPSRWKYQTGT